MLQQQAYQEHLPDRDQDQGLNLWHFYEIFKRRAFYFAIPFLTIFIIGSLIAALWPSKYISEGRILVESQQIPTELVRPTVAVLANERIQIIQQRIMTRDNLLTIAKKYQLSNSWLGQMSGTEVVDFIRERTQIKAAELLLPTARQDNREKQAIAFTVGFTHEQPQVAMRVANELVTMILNEDVRGRTNSATETTKFLDQEAKRLEGQLGLVNNKIFEITRSTSDPTTDDGKALAALKSELIVKSAIYSDTHPEIRALKRKVEGFEKSRAQNAPVLDALQAQKISLEKELASATQKLTAARLGESLESGQQSERLQVVEQASLPEKPVSPNRPKVFALVFALALMAGGGLVVAAEMLNPSIRHSTDLFSIIDSYLIVSIPYISTKQEVERKKKRLKLAAAISAAVLAAALMAFLILGPPLDILFAKLATILRR